MSDVAVRLPPLPEPETLCGAPLMLMHWEYRELMQAYARQAVLMERERPVWQTIESAPKDGTMVDLWCYGEREVNCKWSDAAQSWLALDDGTWWAISGPTHWMPLPQPPNEDHRG